MNLAETQRLLWDLLHGRERPLDAFVSSPDLPAAERVAIYTRMFVDRQVDALRETFPKVPAALGDGEAAEARAGRLAQEGALLGDGCGALDDPGRAAETLQGWLGEGWIAG